MTEKRRMDQIALIGWGSKDVQERGHSSLRNRRKIEREVALKKSDLAVGMLVPIEDSKRKREIVEITRDAYIRVQGRRQYYTPQQICRYLESNASA